MRSRNAVCMCMDMLFVMVKSALRCCKLHVPSQAFREVSLGYIGTKGGENFQPHMLVLLERTYWVDNHRLWFHHLKSHGQWRTRVLHVFSSVIAYVAPKAHSLKTSRSALEWDMLDLLKKPKANGSATEQYRWHENKTCMHSLVPTSSIASYKTIEYPQICRSKW